MAIGHYAFVRTHGAVHCEKCSVSMQTLSPLQALTMGQHCPISSNRCKFLVSVANDMGNSVRQGRSYVDVVSSRYIIHNLAINIYNF